MSDVGGHTTRMLVAEREVERLRAENATLREENERLHKELREVEQELRAAEIEVDNWMHAHKEGY